VITVDQPLDNKHFAGV
jgi:hypothetical protein